MATFASTNPAQNYSVIGSVGVSTPKDIAAAVAGANKAKKSWHALGVKKRISYVKKIYRACKARAPEIAELITREVGTPITACLDEVLWNKGYFEWFLNTVEQATAPVVVGKDNASLHTVYYEPIGSAAVITPWNLPFDMFVWGAIPNLLVGNTVIYKAAEECALTGKLLEDICSSAELPEGVLSFVHGDGSVGSALAHDDVDLIWFTGSTAVGQQLYELAGKKFVKAVLEMGGSNPAIIFEDADMDVAVSAVLSKRFMFCGQTCDADKRLLVHESVFDRVVERLKAGVDAMIVGDPADPNTTMGPLASEKQLNLLVSQVGDAVKKGAKVVVGGKPVSGRKGAFYEPTILTGITQQMRVWKEEVFGPVLPVIPFSSEDQAIRMANHTEFGLGSQVFTADRERALRVAGNIQAGNVDINGVGHFRPYNPFGGYKKSGVGREHGIDGLRELCQVKIVSRNL